MTKINFVETPCIHSVCGLDHKPSQTKKKKRKSTDFDLVFPHPVAEVAFYSPTYAIGLRWLIVLAREYIRDF